MEEDHHMGKVSAGAPMSLDGFIAGPLRPDQRAERRHPLGVTTVVLTHRPPDDRPQADENFVFVTDGSMLVPRRS
jgi:hypothetical protein